MSAASDTASAERVAPTQPRAAGRASILVPLALAALAALVVTVWVLRTPSGSAPSAAGPRANSEHEEAVEPASPALRLELGTGEQPAAPDERIPLERRPRSDPRTRFAGSGTLEGRLRVPAGVAAPERWSLVLAPSRALIGGEHARARREEFAGGQLEFSLADVPLGGYEVWAEADGMSGHHEHLLLARPDATLVYQDLRLVPLAFVEGRVHDDAGVGVAHLPLFLRPIGAGARLSSETDERGFYRFERVPDGSYLIEVGFADAPLCPVRELAVVSPSLLVPPLEVPRLYELVALVRDPDGRPLAGALVRGWCSAGGRVEATSDTLGFARQPFVPAGRVTLEATHPERPELGHVRVHADFPPAADRPLELTLQR